MRAEFIHRPGNVTQKEAHRLDCPATDISTHRPFSFVNPKSGRRMIGFTGFVPAPELLRQTNDHPDLKQQGHDLLLQAIRKYALGMRNGTPFLANYVQSSLIYAGRSDIATETEVYGQLEAGVVVFDTAYSIRTATLGAVSVLPYANMADSYRHNMWTEYTSDIRHTGQLPATSGSLQRSNLRYPLLIQSYGIESDVKGDHLVESYTMRETPPHKDGIAMLVSV